VHFLHGIPGTLGAITAALCVAAYETNFENDLHIMAQFGEDFDRSLATQTGY